MKELEWDLTRIQFLVSNSKKQKSYSVFPTKNRQIWEPGGPIRRGTAANFAANQSTTVTDDANCVAAVFFLLLILKVRNIFFLLIWAPKSLNK